MIADDQLGAAGAFVPPNMVQVSRGFFGRLGEKIGLLGPKLVDMNAVFRTNVEVTVGATFENIFSGMYSGRTQ